MPSDTSTETRADYGREPGGKALIDKIRHGAEYKTTFAENGCVDVFVVSSRAANFLLALLTFGSLRPVRLLATKSSPLCELMPDERGLER